MKAQQVITAAGCQEYRRWVGLAAVIITATLVLVYAINKGHAAGWLAAEGITVEECRITDATPLSLLPPVTLKVGYGCWLALVAQSGRPLSAASVYTAAGYAANGLTRAGIVIISIRKQE